MIPRRTLLRLAVNGSLLAALAACGKKGPPKRPGGSTGMKVDPEKLKKKKASSPGPKEVFRPPTFEAP